MEIELEFLDSFMNQDIIDCNNFWIYGLHICYIAWRHV